ncbi:MAG: hypothetical protein IIB00_00530 [candidate division Zixibacteria bacterium]|nr:hypothetical protein [candidate division Zixibacteria bacterium]
MNTNLDHNEDFLDKDFSREESSLPDHTVGSDPKDGNDPSGTSAESPRQVLTNGGEGLDCKGPESIETESRRAEAIADAQMALKLAAKLKLMSINVAVEAAKRKGDPYQMREIKKSIGVLANRAMKASNQMDDFIASCRGEESVSGSEKSDYLQAVELSKELRSILSRTQSALAAIDSTEGNTRGLFGPAR